MSGGATLGAPQRLQEIALGAACGLVVAGVGALPASRPVLLVAGVVGIVALLTTTMEQKVLAYFVLLPLVRWADIHVASLGPVKNVPDLIAFGILVQLSWGFLLRRVRLPLGHPFVLLVLGYVAIVLVQSRNPIITPTGEGLPGARVYLEPLVLFFGGLALVGDPGFLRRWLRVVVVTALLTGAWMARQLLFGFTASEVVAQREDAIRTLAEQKLFSTLGTPSVYGFVAGLFVLLCLVARSAGIWPRLAVVGAGLGAVGVVASGLRIAVIGLVPSILVVVVVLATGSAPEFGRRALVTFLAGAVVLTTLVLVAPVGDRDDSFEASNPVQAAVGKLALLKAGGDDEDVAGRVRRLGEFTDYMGRHPEGAGPGIVKLVDATVALDPDVPVPPIPAYILDEPWIFQHDFYYFAVGVELGLVPLFLLLVLLVAMAVTSFRVRRVATDPMARAVLLGSAAVAVLVLIQSLTNESFRTPQVAGYVWFLAAMPVVWSGRGTRLRRAPSDEIQAAAV